MSNGTSPPATTHASNQTSRLMVRNLPKHLTAERLRDHFAQKGAITDIKLAKDKEGKSRRFGFIGFKSEQDAANALKYFNNTFIDTSRIEVVYAKPIGDASIPRPWSKHSEGSSSNARELQKVQNREQVESDRKKPAAVDRKKSSANQSKNFLSELTEAQRNDPKFKEFLDVMRPRGAAKGRTWANDDDVGERDLLWDPPIANITQRDGEDDEDDGLYQDLNLKSSSDENDASEEVTEAVAKPDPVAHDATVSDMEYLRSRMRAKLNDEFFGDEENNADEETAAVIETDSDENFEIEPQNQTPDTTNQTITTGQFPKSSPFISSKGKIAKQIEEMFKEPNFDNKNEPSNSTAILTDSTASKETEATPPVEIIADTGRLFIKNLAFTCTTDDLKLLFGKFGPLSEVHMSIDKETKKPRGYAFILFMLPEHAVKAYTTLDNQIFQGRILEILPGKEKTVAPEEDLTKLTPDASYKKKLEIKKRKEAANEYSWNSLFINSDAVVEAMARKLNVKKRDILDPSSENMAVRLALAETDIINETKTYLEQEGIDLNAFTRTKVRSNTILLAKNIPAGTTAEEIDILFAKFGSLGRVVVPPSGTVAMVEFLEPNECKTAFRRLAYTKFKTLPLFLEFAPVGAFKLAYDSEAERARKLAIKTITSDDDEDDDAKESKKTESDNVQQNIDAKMVKAVAKTTAKKLSKKEALEQAMKPSADFSNAATMDDPDAMPVATLFVKNLSFDTTEDALRKKFAAVGGLRSVRIAAKPDTKKGGGAVLSMGFGFLEFERKEDAVRAVKALQGTDLDGHKLQLKFSNAATKGNSTTNINKRNLNQGEMVNVTGSKLIIRNIPFQATKKDVKQLFSAFGQVKTVRLPLKFDGTHRGFAFVDFLTKQEAKAAFATLGSTHLYGRHLVMEWAEDESSIEALRSKTAKNFTKDGEGGGKRRKVILGDEDQEADVMSD
ncbi:putative RNA-binding protein 19 [Physocladia obscura]|uniref:RNA-binding protein 19 n=1 Tax=Physocladia obscura TaxID=109957 RepID=A0AAD5SVH7_9FUNG|nr:putative RNA-binding protein 19 [Physocladia obscura]